MKVFRLMLTLIFIVGILLAACSPQAAPADEPAAEEPAAEEPAEEEPAEEPPAAEIPVGGNLLWVNNIEPDTLDWQKSALTASMIITNYLSASLLKLDQDGQLIPWLAESYTVSEDGLVYEFKLREDVKFHDGTPLTAEAYAWSFNRALDPETASPVTGESLGTATSIEAVDDYVMRITLESPFAPMLFLLAETAYTGPLSPTALEAMGDEAFGRAPVGVGPYMVEEWVTADHITLKRNPDYNWGPADSQNTGPYYIETITYRFIPEYATRLAGLQAGEVTFTQLETKDVPSVEADGLHTLFTAPAQGLQPELAINVSKPPLDDISVRQAINLAIDRQAIIDVVFFGSAEIQYGVLSPVQTGYWEGVSEFGYGYEPEQAKQLLADSGYTLNSDSLLEKDGEVLSLTFQFPSGDDTYVRIGQILKQQLAEVGIQIEIEQNDVGIVIDSMIAGTYDGVIIGVGGFEADLLHLMFHSEGGINWVSWVNDPELDVLLDLSRTTTDPDDRQEVLNQVQQMVIEKAYFVPMVNPTSYYAVDKSVQGAYMTIFEMLELADAYFVDGE